MTTAATGSADPTNNAPAPGMSRREIEELVSGIVGKGKDSADVQRILSDNFEYRQKIRDLTAEVEGLKVRVPAADSVVLTGDAKKEYEALLGLGKPAADIKRVIAEHGSLTTEVEGYRTAAVLSRVAIAEGYNAKGAVEVLKTIVGNREITFENVEEEQEDAESGEKKKVSVERAFFVVENADKTKTKKRVDEVVKSDHKAFVPALRAEDKADENDESGSNESSTATQGARSGTEFMRQGNGSRAAGKGSSTNAAAAYLAKTYRKPAQGAR